MNTELILTLIWTGTGFLAGSMMFSLWIGKLAGKDILDFGDGNPGATNAWKAGGWKIGLPGAMLDFCKGAVPVALAVWVSGLESWFIVPIALAPVLGHAFSPFMKFKGGKAIAVTLGVWTGLTVWEGLLILGLLIGFCYLIVDSPSWALIVAMLAYLTYMLILGLLVRGMTYPLYAVWAGNFFVFLYKHRYDLKEPIKAKTYISRFFRRAH